MLPAHPSKVDKGRLDLPATGIPQKVTSGLGLIGALSNSHGSQKGNSVLEKASCQVLTSGFTILEGSGSQVLGGEASSTGEAGSTAGFRLECAQGTELAGCKAIRRKFTRLAKTWGTNDPR